MRWEKGEGDDYQGQEETFGGDGYAHGLVEMVLRDTHMLKHQIVDLKRVVGRCYISNKAV